MLTLRIRNFFCLLVLILCSLCAEVKQNVNAEEKPVDITDFIVIERIRIPILTEWGINFFEFDVKITGMSAKDVEILKSYSSRIRDLILSDGFDSVCALVYGQKSVTSAQINALQRRIWICLLKWVGKFKLPIHITHVDILHAKYFVKKRVPSKTK